MTMTPSAELLTVCANSFLPRDAMLARYITYRGPLSVRPCVRLFVTNRCFIKTAEVA